MGASVSAVDMLISSRSFCDAAAERRSNKPCLDTPVGGLMLMGSQKMEKAETKQEGEKYKDKFRGITGCDTELLAWGLDEFGLNFIDELDSMHGFAYYKHKEEQLIISRDHAGIKPLYYAEIDKGLVFGSELKGMLDKVPGARKLDKLASSFQSRTGCNPLRNTLFSGIKQLLPGETLTYCLKQKKFVDSKRI